MGKGHGGTRDGSGRKPKIEPPTASHGRDWARMVLEQLDRPAKPEDSYDIQQWRLLTEAKDLRIRLDARKILIAYLFGKPVQPIVGDDQLPPVQINISALPMTRNLTKR